MLVRFDGGTVLAPCLRLPVAVDFVRGGFRERDRVAWKRCLCKINRMTGSQLEVDGFTGVAGKFQRTAGYSYSQRFL